MRASRKPVPLIFLTVLGLALILSPGCDRRVEPLVVYAGKGLTNAMEEVKLAFEQQDRTPISIIYAGSDTLLTTLQQTRKGDVFIPGSPAYLKRAGSLSGNARPVALHVPAFVVRADNPKSLRAYADLLANGVRIAVGNKDMCAIGRVAENIIHDSDPRDSFQRNIVITGSTVNELLHLVVHQEVDAALIWSDMLQWPEAKGLQAITIPDAINKPKEIQVAVLTTSIDPKRAARFADFVAGKGRAIFIKHGFGAR